VGPLPEEMLLYILKWTGYADVKSVCHCRLVCRSWNRIATEESMWRSFFHSHVLHGRPTDEGTSTFFPFINAIPATGWLLKSVDGQRDVSNQSWKDLFVEKYTESARERRFGKIDHFTTSDETFFSGVESGGQPSVTRWIGTIPFQTVAPPPPPQTNLWGSNHWSSTPWGYRHHQSFQPPVIDDNQVERLRQELRDIEDDAAEMKRFLDSAQRETVRQRLEWEHRSMHTHIDGVRRRIDELTTGFMVPSQTAGSDHPTKPW
jgi:hypothetical protein